MKPKRRHRKRRENTNVRKAKTKDLLTMLHQYGFKPSGAFDPESRDVIMFPGADDSVLEHEMTHAQQYGPIAQKLGFEPRVQDRRTRRASNVLTRRMSQDTYEGLGKDGFSPLKYMVDDPKEFEAIVSSAVKSPEAQAVDFSKSFDDIRKDLDALPEDRTNTNLRLLRKAMSEGNMDKKQKRLFLKALRSNLRS